MIPRKIVSGGANSNPAFLKPSPNAKIPEPTLPLNRCIMVSRYLQLSNRPLVRVRSIFIARREIPCYGKNSESRELSGANSRRLKTNDSSRMTQEASDSSSGIVRCSREIQRRKNESVCSRFSRKLPVRTLFIEKKTRAHGSVRFDRFYQRQLPLRVATRFTTLPIARVV